MQLGMVGLGRMGANMVRRLMKGGHECVVYNRSPEAVQALVKEGARGATSLDDFVSKLQLPRVVWLMVPAAVVESSVAELSGMLQQDDVIIDGGNSYYIDDIRRANELRTKGIHYLDVGSTTVDVQFRGDGIEQLVTELEPIGDAMGEQALNEKYPGRTVCREGDRIVVSIPVRFRRRNGRQMIFAAGDGPEDKSKSDDNALVVALARAWQWQEELEAGEYSTVEELSAAKKIDVSYVRRMLRLNSLAPDIVEAILQDQAPDRISLRTLYRGIAQSWAEQRRQLLEI